MKVLQKTTKKAAKIAAKDGKKIVKYAERTRAARLITEYIEQGADHIIGTIKKVTKLDLKPKGKGLWSATGMYTRQPLLGNRPLGGEMLKFNAVVDTAAEKVTAFSSKVVAHLKNAG